MFELYSVYVVNTASGCSNYVEQQVSISACTNVIIRITSNTNAIGPFDIYVDSLDSTPIRTGVSRQEMLDGVVIQIGPCEEFEMYITTQDWIPLITQDDRLWDVRGFVYPFNVATGNVPNNVCIDSSTSITLYGVGVWESVDRFYLDAELTSPLNGNNLWYKNNSSGYTSETLFQIDSEGFPINTFNC
jgi:hypothetical protein